MTTRQIIFIDEYLKDLNATKAAIRSGYSQTTAYSIGSENLKKPEIKEILLEEFQLRSIRSKITSDQLIKALAGIAFAQLSDFADWDDKGIYLKPSNQIESEKLQGLQLVDVSKQKVQIDFNKKIKALELLGRHLGMW